MRRYQNLIVLCFGLLGCFPWALSQNVAPVAVDDAYTVGYDHTLNVAATNGLLTNDSDANGPMTLSVRSTPVSGPTNGAVSLNADGSFDYTPNPGYIGADSFTYQVCDDGTPTAIVSRFDFDTATLTDATIGPNATSVNPNAAQTGCGMHFPSGAGGSTGFDVVVPNTSGIFGFTSFEVSFDYQDLEGTADVVTAGNFRIYHIGANTLGIQVTVINGATGIRQTFTQSLGNFLGGNNPYSVAYSEMDGVVTYTANGTTTTFSVAPPNSPLDTSLATDVIVGRFMDGSGSALPSLCSIEFVDASVLCDSATVTLSVIATVVTNRKITYRILPD